MSARLSLLVAAVLGATAVALGAFGAHALSGRLSGEALGWYGTAADYHVRHALALFGCGLLGTVHPSGRALSVAGLALAAGTVVFAGSLYLMALTGARWLGAVTPIGGALLIVGWVALAVAAAGIPTAARRD